jgi:predicted NUDIX family NTP pyrophosphohydrolase
VKKISAGLLMYKIRNEKPEVLLVHPGGPFWKNKDDGAWDIPKGEAEEGEEDLLAVAKREFREETSFEALGNFKHLINIEKKDKNIELWYFEGDLDPALIKSNTFLMEWPPKSGKHTEYPEVDRGGFFTIEEAKKKIYSYLLPAIEAFEKVIQES